MKNLKKALLFAMVAPTMALATNINNMTYDGPPISSNGKEQLNGYSNEVDGWIKITNPSN